MKLALAIFACALAVAAAGGKRGGGRMRRRMMLFKKCNIELVQCARGTSDAFEAAGFGSFELAMNKALGAHKEAFECAKESPCFEQIMCMMKSDSSKSVMGCLKEGFMGMRQAAAGDDGIVARVKRAIEGDDDDDSSGSGSGGSSSEEGGPKHGHGHGGKKGGRGRRGPRFSKIDKIAMVLQHGPLAADMTEKFCGADETAKLKECIIRASGLGESAADCDKFMALMQAAGCGCKAGASEQCAALNAKQAAMMSAMVELKCACGADHADAVRKDFAQCTDNAEMPQIFSDALDEGTCEAIDLDKCDDAE